MRADNGSGWVWNDTGYNLPMNSEHTLTSVYDGAAQTLKFYVDGGLVSTSTANVPSSLYTGYNGNDLLFGERGANVQPLEGTLDNIRIYDSALSDAQVATIETVSANLVAAYDFESANPLTDTSGNGHDATLQNGATVTTVTEGPTEDIAFTINSSTLLANDYDVDGDAITVTSVSATANTHGTVVLNGDGTITYTPDANYNGAASFDYTISDGALTDTATVNFTLQSVNDLPVITMQTTAQTNEDNSIDISYSISDVEDGTVNSVIASASHGSVTLNGNGTFTYTPNADYNGNDTVTITATDSDGGVSNSTVAITVNPVNDAPVAVDDTQIGIVDHYVDVTPNHAAINTGNSINFTNAFTISQDVKATGAGIVFNKENVYEVAIEGDGSVRYAMRADNGSGWVWNDTGYNLPMNSEHTLTSVYDGAAQTLKFYVDGGLVSTSTANVPSSLYTGYNGNDLLFGERGANVQPLEGTLDNIRIYDSALSDAQVATIETVSANLVAAYDFESANPLTDTSGNGHDATLQNGAVIIDELQSPVNIATNEDTVLTFNSNTLLVNDYDVDGDAITVTSVSATANTHGTVVLNGDGTITYTPDNNYNGAASFDYTISDGALTDTAAVLLTVDAVNDLPTIDNIQDIYTNFPTPLFDETYDGEVGGVKTFHSGVSSADNRAFTDTFDTDLTLSAWIQMDGNIDDYARVVEFGENIGTYYKDSSAITFGSGATKNTIRAWTNEEGPEGGRTPEVTYDMSAYINDGNMHLVTYTFDNNYARLYVDGIEVDTVQITTPITSIDDPDTINIGGYDNTNVNIFEGDIDGVGVFHQALTPVQIADQFNAGSGTVIPPANNTHILIDASDSGMVDLFNVTASDIEDDAVPIALNYSLADDYNGLFSIDATGKITVNADNTFFQSSYSLDVRVTDSDAGQSNQLLTVDVKDAGSVAHLNMNGNLNDTAIGGDVNDTGTSHGNAVTTGGVLQLDGTGDYVDFVNSSDINTDIYTERSISLWFKSSDGVGTQYMYAEGGGIRSLQIYTENGVLMAKGYNDPASENNWDSATPTILNTGITVTDGEWHNVTVTLTGDAANPLHGLLANGMKIYLDGTFEQSGTGGALYGHDNAHIGSYYNGNNTFSGSIEDVQIFNQELSSSDVNTIVNSSQLGDTNDNNFTYDNSLLIYEGGSGTDSLSIAASDTIDLSNVGDISNIEVVTLNNSAGFSTALNLSDITTMTDSTNHLTIDGDNSNHISIDGTTMQVGATANGYTQYQGITDPTVVVEVDTDILVTVA